MELIVLGSSSAGNGYILKGGEESLLLEAGVKAMEMKKAMDFDIRNIVGCLVTHEHGDHAKYLNEYAGIKMYMSKGTADAKGLARYNRLEAGKMESIGGFRVIPFLVKHDAAEPFGYFINHAECGNVLFATDTYYLPQRFAGLNNIMIECNYSRRIIRRNVDSGDVPESLAERVMMSHFSVDNCADALKANDLTNVSRVVLIHMSEGNCDSNEAVGVIRDAVQGRDVVVARPGTRIQFNKTPF